jgi:hypothetical protein
LAWSRARYFLAIAPVAGAKVHRCAPTDQYWTNIRVDHLTCRQAYRLHSEKLRRCMNPSRRVTPRAYVYTCRFGPWIATERTDRHGPFFDRVYIRKHHGRIWLRYDALP